MRIRLLALAVVLALASGCASAEPAVAPAAAPTQATATAVPSTIVPSTEPPATTPASPTPTPTTEPPATTPASPTSTPTTEPPATTETPATTTAAPSGSSGVRLDVLVTAEDGSFFGDDREYRSDYPDDALTWRGVIEFDLTRPYVYYGVDGIAEPGDRGCFEILLNPDGEWARSNFLGGAYMPDFVLSEESSVNMGDESEQLAPTTAVALWESLGVSPPPGESDQGSSGPVMIRSGELSADSLLAAGDIIIDLGGVWQDWQTGTLETREDSNGELLGYVFTAERTGSRDNLTEGNFRFPFDAMRTEVTRSRLEAPYRVTPTTTLVEAGMCQPLTGGVEGDWDLIAVVALGGTSEAAMAAADSLGEFGRTRLEIGPDGRLAGSTGCRTLAGTADLGFLGLVNVDITLDGTPCSGEFAALEEGFAAMLLDEPRMYVDSDGRLWMTDGSEVDSAAGPPSDDAFALLFIPA